MHCMAFSAAGIRGEPLIKVTRIQNKGMAGEGMVNGSSRTALKIIVYL
jgi:hypothetical protein